MSNNLKFIACSVISGLDEVKKHRSEIADAEKRLAALQAEVQAALSEADASDEA
jgi:hypothetical protein